VTKKKGCEIHLAHFLKTEWTQSIRSANGFDVSLNRLTPASTASFSSLLVLKVVNMTGGTKASIC
jgi:hypothetical protein